MNVVFRTEDSALWSLMRVRMSHKLNVVWTWILERLEHLGYEEVVWTSFYRPWREGETGVHSIIPCPVLDFFVPGMGYKDIELFENEVNSHWSYGKVNPKTDEEYKVIQWHDTGRGFHFHLQTQNETHKCIEEE